MSSNLDDNQQPTHTIISDISESVKILVNGEFETKRPPRNGLFCCCLLISIGFPIFYLMMLVMFKQKIQRLITCVLFVSEIILLCITLYYDNFDVCFVEYLIEFNRNIHDEQYLDIKVLDNASVYHKCGCIDFEDEIEEDIFKGCLCVIKSKTQFEKAIMKIFPEEERIEIELCDKYINKLDKESFEF
ncbi:hypothetical protein QTN25_010122 [Entamoeba marina]